MSDLNIKESNSIALSRWENLSALGQTGHPGGKAATEELVTLCDMQPGNSILVIGCGDGASVLYIAEKLQTRIVATDLAVGMVGETRQRCSSLTQEVVYVQARGDRLPFKSNIFDGVWAESVTLLMSPALAFEEYFRVIRPGGFVADNEPTWKAKTPLSVKAFTQGVIDRVGTGAVFARDLDEWMSALSLAGFVHLQGERRPYSAFQTLFETVSANRSGLLRLVSRVLSCPTVLRPSLTTERWRYRAASRFLSTGLFVGWKP